MDFHSILSHVAHIPIIGFFFFFLAQMSPLACEDPVTPKSKTLALSVMYAGAKLPWVNGIQHKAAVSQWSLRSAHFEQLLRKHQFKQSVNKVRGVGGTCVFDWVTLSHGGTLFLHSSDYTAWCVLHCNAAKRKYRSGGSSRWKFMLLSFAMQLWSSKIGTVQYA